MDIRLAKRPAELGSKKDHGSKDCFYLKERTRKLAEVKACREAWRTCSHHLWMDVLRRLDVRTYRRLSRVSRDWQSNLQDVPRYNKGIFYLNFSTKLQFLQFKTFFPNGHECFEHIGHYAPELFFSPARCILVHTLRIKVPIQEVHIDEVRVHWEGCQFRKLDPAHGVGRKQHPPFDYVWWGKVFGVSNLSVVKKLHYRTAFGAHPLKIWLGIEPSNYEHTLWRARQKQVRLSTY
ncbi:hypothetical protein RvY_10611 [Ramazzottius varieornatus]|uniref:F-box domain-containing protein n=1 Tax=Ramazzottius varieornatus TaxID=947166 RepID=A0A1D1VL50_RAMVA|nr:hypothetical protein RvY_10611 [Ramazzottius varieornatus]